MPSEDRRKLPFTIISHPDCLLHEMSPGHPECPQRLKAIEAELAASSISSRLQRFEAPPATRQQLGRAHTREYLDRLEALSPERGLVYLDPDTAMNPYTLRAARLAAGAAVLGAELVLEGKAAGAFCNIRPPGHHAGPDYAMGFCIFNNVAVGVAHALEHYGLERVAIADFDVHHGNGTEDIFRNEPRVMLCSTFQHPFYPFRGADSSGEHVINVPLAAGTGSVGFRKAVQERWLPALERFAPQLIFVSAGFDAHHEDPLAALQLDESDYAWVTQQIRAVAERFANGRIVSVLEGGYALPALGRSALAHIRALCE